eukprot:10306097-Karenia_brevis.AAC.1
MDFCSCEQLADVSALGNAVGKLQQLKQLHMDFSGGFFGCSQLADVNAVGDGVGKLQQLQQLHIGFGGGFS